MKPSLGLRARAAWNAILYGIPPMDTLRSISRKEAPFLWPTWVSGRPQWNIVDFNSYVKEGFERNSLIYSAIMYKVRSVSTAPLRAYTGSMEKPEMLEENHPLSQLVKRPNRYQSGRGFMGLNTVFLNISGNSYVMLDRPRIGAMPTAMYPLLPNRVMIVPEGKEVKGYVYVPEGKSIQDGTPILPEDMMHVKLPNPGDPLEGMGYGLSPFAAMAQSADVDNSVTAYLNLFFKHGAAPNIYLEFVGNIDDDVAARARARFMEMYGGYENWIGPAIVDNGGKISTFGQNFKEMGFDSIDERTESRVLGVFGVPGILIGTRLGVNRAINANAIELRRTFWQDTLLPELYWYEDEYQEKLNNPVEDIFVAFDTSGVPALAQDKVAAVSAYATLVANSVPPNVAASYLDMEFNVDLPEGDTAYISSSLVPVGGAAAPVAPVSEVETTPLTIESEDTNVTTEETLLGKGTSVSIMELKKQADMIAVLLERAVKTVEAINHNGHES